MGWIFGFFIQKQPEAKPPASMHGGANIQKADSETEMFNLELWT